MDALTESTKNKHAYYDYGSGSDSEMTTCQNECMHNLRTDQSLDADLEKFRDLLYELDYRPGDNKVAVNWILPRLKGVIDTWKINTHSEQINKLINISSGWHHLNKFDLIDVSKVVDILYEIKKELKTIYPRSFCFY